jgi:hypothetical protein
LAQREFWITKDGGAGAPRPSHPPCRWVGRLEVASLGPGATWPGCGGLSGRAPGRRGVPALALFSLSKVLKIERPDVMAGRVKVLAAGQAPWAARRLVTVGADPEPGRVVPAVGAELDGVRQQAGRGYRAPPGVRGCGSRPVLVGRHARASITRCHPRVTSPGGEICEHDHLLRGH